MPVHDIFSKRQKRSRGEVSDVYQHETIHYELRVQVFYIMEDVLRIIGDNSITNKIYEFIHKILCREYGVFTLDSTSSNEGNGSDSYSVINFFLQTEETEKVIDIIELFFQRINQHLPNSQDSIGAVQNILPNKAIPKLKNGQSFLDRAVQHAQYKEAIDELNQRFRECGVGYQYESGQMIRVDSQFIHSEAVQPVLKMLADPMYEGANAEFLSAHKHYRAQDYKACINDCLKAFESCIKSICDARGWAHNAGDTAHRLIGIVFDHELIPTFMKSHFSALRSTLESGVPTVRNDQSAHGQGPKIVDIPEHIAAYVLHLTASNILLLAKANDEMK